MGSVLCFFAMRAILPQQTDEVKTVALAAAAAEATETPNLQPVSFSSGLIERAVRETLGMDETTPIYESDLERVTQLMIYGDMVYSDWDTFIHDVTYRTPEGNGTLFTMDDVAKFPNLHMLGIVDQKIFDLSILEQTMIETLALSNNLITDLSPLTKMPCLSKLYVKGNPISNISPLGAIPTLKLLDIGNTQVIDLTPINGCNLQTLWMKDTPVIDYSPLVSMPQLKTLWVSRLDAQALSICSQLTQLNSLAIYETPVLTSLAPIKNMKDLNFLDLVNDGIKNIEDIDRFPNIYFLCLMGNPISDFTPLTNPPIVRSLNITYLSIDDYSFLTQISTLKSVYCDAKQGELIRALPGMENIELIVG
jgi:Leucine-rich repeat (LRR) protein